MGKTYLFVTPDRAKAIKAGNEFMRRMKAIKRKARYFCTPYKNKTGTWVCAIDVCGSDYRDCDSIAECIRGEL